MKNKFGILKTGNFYFPFIDKGKEFIVKDTIEVTLDKKDTRLIEFCLKHKNIVYFDMLAKPIWNALKKLNLKKYKNYWFVPIRLYKFGKDYICSIDFLKEVKLKK